MREFNLFDISNPKQWKTISSEELMEDGQYPVYGANGIIGYYDRYNHEKETVLITCRGATCGEVNLSKPFSYINGNAMALDDVDENILSTKYLYYYFKQYNFQSVISGSAQPQITRAGLKNVSVPIPDLQTQNKIVAILDKASALVQKRQQTIDLLDELLRAQFLEMFGQVAHYEPTSNSEPLGNFISIKHGFAFKSQYFTSEGEFVLLTPGNFKEEGGYRDRGEKQKFYNGPIPEGYLLSKDDLLVAMTEQAPGLLGSPVLIPQSNIFLHNQRLGLIEFRNENLNKRFLYYLFNTGLMRNIIHVRSTGVKVRHTSPTKIEAIDVTIPPMAKQEKFSMIAQKIEITRFKNSKSLEQTNELFFALLQRAFSGKLNLDISVELDALLEEIDLQKPENDLFSIITNEEYLLSLVNRLNNQEFENQDLYDKAKHVAFQLLKAEERLAQEYDEQTQSLKLVVQ